MIDPMLATGGSAVARSTHLTQATPRHPDDLHRRGARRGRAVQSTIRGAIYVPAIDRHFNEHKYIVPARRLRRPAYGLMTSPHSTRAGPAAEARHR
jgi:uracil phosphoribosyltransferase